MGEKGMIFTGESVRAILGDRKTQTRRTVNGQSRAWKFLGLERRQIKTTVDKNGGQIGLEAARELIRPYFQCDEARLLENALTVKTRYIIYSLRDKKGIRNVFADESGTYRDVTLPLSDEDYRKIEQQLREKAVGALKAWRKVLGTRKEIVGQITFDEFDNLMAGLA